MFLTRRRVDTHLFHIYFSLRFDTSTKQAMNGMYWMVGYSRAGIMPNNSHGICHFKRQGVMTDYNEGDACRESTGRWIDYCPVTCLPFPLTLGGVNLMELKNCWSYTELESQMLNTYRTQLLSRRKEPISDILKLKTHLPTFNQEDWYFFYSKNTAVNLCRKSLLFYTSSIYTVALFGDCQPELELGILCDTRPSQETHAAQ